MRNSFKDDVLGNNHLNEMLSDLLKGWKVSYNPDISFMTAKANERNRFSVERTVAPFCTRNGETVWMGGTLFEALQKGLDAFESEKEKWNDPKNLQLIEYVKNLYSEDGVLSSSKYKKFKEQIGFYIEQYDKILKKRTELDINMPLHVHFENDLNKELNEVIKEIEILLFNYFNKG